MGGCRRFPRARREDVPSVACRAPHAAIRPCARTQSVWCVRCGRTNMPRKNPLPTGTFVAMVITTISSIFHRISRHGGKVGYPDAASASGSRRARNATSARSGRFCEACWRVTRGGRVSLGQVSGRPVQTYFRRDIPARDFRTATVWHSASTPVKPNRPLAAGACRRRAPTARLENATTSAGLPPHHKKSGTSLRRPRLTLLLSRGVASIWRVCRPRQSSTRREAVKPCVGNEAVRGRRADEFDPIPFAMSHATKRVLRMSGLRCHKVRAANSAKVSVDTPYPYSALSISPSD